MRSKTTSGVRWGGGGMGWSWGEKWWQHGCWLFKQNTYQRQTEITRTRAKWKAGLFRDPFCICLGQWKYQLPRTILDFISALTEFLEFIKTPKYLQFRTPTNTCPFKSAENEYQILWNTKLNVSILECDPSSLQNYFLYKFLIIPFSVQKCVHVLKFKKIFPNIAFWF